MQNSLSRVELQSIFEIWFNERAFFSIPTNMDFDTRFSFLFPRMLFAIKDFSTLVLLDLDLESFL